MGGIVCGFFGGGDGNDNDVKFDSENALARSCGAKVWIKPFRNCILWRVFEVCANVD